MAEREPELLAVVELGGYPNFVPLYRAQGYRVSLVTSMRKALAQLKKSVPDVIVAEFNFQSDFRDRSSNLESLLGRLQRYPDCRVIVFYELEQAERLARLRERFEVFEALAFPIEEARLEAVLVRAVAGA